MLKTVLPFCKSKLKRKMKYRFISNYFQNGGIFYFSRFTADFFRFRTVVAEWLFETNWTIGWYYKNNIKIKFTLEVGPTTVLILNNMQYFLRLRTIVLCTNGDHILYPPAPSWLTSFLDLVVRGRLEAERPKSQKQVLDN